LQDIYLCGCFQATSVDSSIGSPSSDLLQLVESVSLRLLLQILMVGLSDRNVLIVARDTSISQSLLQALPYLAKPFNLNKTHLLLQESLSQLPGRGLPWLAERANADCSASKRPQPWIASTTTSSLGIILPALASSPSARHETLIADIDACRIIAHDSRQSVPSPSTAAAATVSSASFSSIPKLCQDVYFKKWNSKSFARLKEVIDKLHQQRYHKSYDTSSIPNESIVPVKTINEIIGRHFSIFWLEILLSFLPANIVYYPSPHQIIALHVLHVLHELIDRQSHLLSHPTSYYHQQVANMHIHGLTDLYNDGDVELWFAVDVLSRSATSLVDILFRHGQAIQRDYTVTTSRSSTNLSDL
jgi:hypothetical protein